MRAVAPVSGRSTKAIRLSTARGPMTVRRAMAVSRVTALSDARSAASASTCAADDFLMVSLLLNFHDECGSPVQAARLFA